MTVLILLRVMTTTFKLFCLFLNIWPIVKVKFLSTFNAAPSTSNHDWNNIGHVTVSSDFIPILYSIPRIILRHLLCLQVKTTPWQSNIQGIQNLMVAAWVISLLLISFSPYKSFNLTTPASKHSCTSSCSHPPQHLTPLPVLHLHTLRTS